MMKANKILSPIILIMSAWNLLPIMFGLLNMLLDPGGSKYLSFSSHLLFIFIFSIPIIIAIWSFNKPSKITLVLEIIILIILLTELIWGFIRFLPYLFI